MKSKIIKIKNISLNEEEKKLKNKLEKVDKIIDSISNVGKTMKSNNSDTMFSDQTLENLIAIVTTNVSIDILEDYVKNNLKD